MADAPEPGSPQDPHTQYPTSFLLDRIRKSGRRRKIYWVLMTLVLAGGAASFFVRYFR